MANTGKIYKILCNETGEVYYGSTIRTLSHRKNGHKQDVKKYDEGKKTKCECYDIIKRGNFTMSLVEEYSFDNKQQLLWRERHYIENNECVNTRRPIATKKDKYETVKIRLQKSEVHEKKSKQTEIGVLEIKTVKNGNNAKQNQKKSIVIIVKS